MTDSSLDAGEVARYLRDHPDFFTRHVDLLAAITVPHPHSGQAISLQERQLEVLRDRYRTLEMKLADLLRMGEENDAIGDRLQKWTRQLLLSADSTRLPEVVLEGLDTIFSVPQTAMRLWGLRKAHAGAEYSRPVAEEIVTLTDSMTHPFCGPNSDFQAATLLVGGGRETRSLALLPLRKGMDRSFGLIVLGSADSDRFRSGMGTAWLERIAETASAALSRLVD
ncbi:MAG: DUF484 family protein [Gammaproteobacteria bacterium]